MKKFYFVIVVASCTGREALSVDVDFGLDLMDAFAQYINVGDDIIKVYPMRNLEQAQEVAQKINSLQDKKSQYMEEVIMFTETDEEVFQHLEYDKLDPEGENYHIARMDECKKSRIEKETEDVKKRLQGYHDFMRQMLGDGVYARHIEQVQHHFGQLEIDLFDPLSGLM